jgi:hypothetical protein
VLPIPFPLKEFLTMHARYATSVIGGLAGGFVVAASLAFTTGTTAWLAFGVGAGLLVLAATPVLFGERDLRAIALDVAGAALAAWTVVASLVFAGQTVKWLSFAEGAAFVLLAVGGLTLDHVRLAHGARAASKVQVAVTNEAVEPSRPTAVAA